MRCRSGCVLMCYEYHFGPGTKLTVVVKAGVSGGYHELTPFQGNIGRKGWPSFQGPGSGKLWKAMWGV